MDLLQETGANLRERFLRPKVLFADDKEDAIDWTITLVMAIAALVGGAIASRVPAKLLRWIVIVAGLGMSAIYFARL